METHAGGQRAQPRAPHARLGARPTTEEGMMATKRHDRLAEVFKEIEGLAKRLRGDIRLAAREAGLNKQIEKAAATLR
ncbi:MAG: hypothetical protein ACRERC_06265, partial [Candidatus Binatia bacterium]